MECYMTLAYLATVSFIQVFCHSPLFVLVQHFIIYHSLAAVIDHLRHNCTNCCNAERCYESCMKKHIVIRQEHILQEELDSSPVMIWTIIFWSQMMSPNTVALQSSGL